VFLEKEDAYTVAPANTKWVRVGENSIAYQYVAATTSPAPTVLFIGGTTAWSGVWKTTLRDLGGKYHVYTIDLPPFGYSVVDEKYRYNLSRQADTINGFLHQVDAKQTILVAHSYGAGPAMEAVFKEQSLYQKLIIIDGAIHVHGDKEVNALARNVFSIPTLRYLMTSAALHVPGFVKASLQYLVYNNSSVTDTWVNIYKQPLHVDNQSRKLAAWFYDFVFENGPGLSHDAENYLGLKLPVRIIWGREDNLTPLDQGLYLAKIIPKNKLIVLDLVGHIPMIDNHEAYLQALQEHLTQ